VGLIGGANDIEPTFRRLLGNNERLLPRIRTGIHQCFVRVEHDPPPTEISIVALYTSGIEDRLDLFPIAYGLYGLVAASGEKGSNEHYRKQAHNWPPGAFVVCGNRPGENLPMPRAKVKGSDCHIKT